MLELERQKSSRIRIARSSTDESLLQIEQYLQDRLAEVSSISLISDDAEISLDIAILGIDHQEYNTRTTWASAIVYPIRLYHSLVILGPVCYPTQGGPCPKCLERRWLAIRPNEEQQALTTPHQTLIYGHNPRITPFALETIWSLVSYSLSQINIQAQNTVSSNLIYGLDLGTFKISRHQLLPDSLCPDCAQLIPDTAANADIRLISRIKPDTSSTRLMKATEYNMPLEGYVNPQCGVLGGVAAYDYQNTITAPVKGIFKVRTKFTLHNAFWSGHGNSFAQSKLLGILEGLERYAGQVPRTKEVSVYDSYQNLEPDAFDPTECGSYESDFYQKHSPVYLPFSRERKMHWVWGYSFKKGGPILVPEQIAYYLDYRSDHANFVQECSNGCATGSCLEEAILYGLLELIERDSFLISWYAKLGLPRIDPGSCRDVETLAMIDRIDRMGYDLHLFDMRLDISVPSVLGVGVKREPGLGHMLLAAGSGLHPEDAIRGALCEVASYIPGFDERVEANLAELREMVHDYSKVTELQHHGLLFGLPEMAPHAEFLFRQQTSSTVSELYADWMERHVQTHDLRDDLLFCINEMLRLGLDVIVVDQTCPEQKCTGLTTVSVIVPGLLPMDFGWERQRALRLPRLRTVPRTAGFLTQDFDLASQPPIPHPFP